jgi:glycosyltransferase involved in cell wall biosynthesis
VRAIPRGIDLAAFDAAALAPLRVAALRREWEIPPGARVVLLPGRLTRWKGHLVLIEALARLVSARRGGLVAVLAGDARGHENYRRALETEARRLGLMERIRIVGHITDMPAAYGASDVVVAPSIAPEAFGRVPIEAQAMGRPVIAADHGGARETIRPDVTGWLVPPNDAPALAAALGAVLDLNAEARARLADHARAHVAARFGSARMCADTLALYRAVLAERGA